MSAVSLLKLCLELHQSLVLDGSVKLSIIEARMDMESGGVLRQGLRMGMSL